MGPLAGKLSKSLLTSSDVFILDAGSELFVWIGSGTSSGEKREAMATAARFLQQSGRPASTPVARVMQGSEPASFKVMGWSGRGFWRVDVKGVRLVVSSIRCGG
jgi:hypothetical protein